MKMYPESTYGVPFPNIVVEVAVNNESRTTLQRNTFRKIRLSEYGSRLKSGLKGSDTRLAGGNGDLVALDVQSTLV